MNYVTLADRNYLVKLLLCLRSLRRASSAWTYQHTVTVLALDAAVADAVERENDPRIRIYHLDDFLRDVPTAAAARVNRPHREWCWTLASALAAQELEPRGAVAYMDADLYFYSDPAAVAPKAPIGIVPHAFAGAYRGREATSGVYNVSMVWFRGLIGARCAQHWYRQVLAECSERTCGDQKYLDAWPTLYPGDVEIVRHPGVGIAPWNVFDRITQIRPGETVPTVDGQPAVFYHYHELERLEVPARGGGGMVVDGVPFRITRGYPLRNVDGEYFYRPYLREYVEIEQELGL